MTEIDMEDIVEKPEPKKRKKAIKIEEEKDSEESGFISYEYHFRQVLKDAIVRGINNLVKSFSTREPEDLEFIFEILKESGATVSQIRQVLRTWSGIVNKQIPEELTNKLKMKKKEKEIEEEDDIEKTLKELENEKKARQIKRLQELKTQLALKEIEKDLQQEEKKKEDEQKTTDSNVVIKYEIATDPRGNPIYTKSGEPVIVPVKIPFNGPFNPFMPFNQPQNQNQEIMKYVDNKFDAIKDMLTEKKIEDKLREMERNHKEEIERLKQRSSGSSSDIEKLVEKLEEKRKEDIQNIMSLFSTLREETNKKFEILLKEKEKKETDEKFAQILSMIEKSNQTRHEELKHVLEKISENRNNKNENVDVSKDIEVLMAKLEKDRMEDRHQFEKKLDEIKYESKIEALSNEIKQLGATLNTRQAITDTQVEVQATKDVITSGIDRIGKTVDTGMMAVNSYLKTQNDLQLKLLELQHGIPKTQLLPQIKEVPNTSITSATNKLIKKMGEKK